ncbi:hypothetical protein GGR53DRAFT_519098 [Hypoxylon sp. FL1150]|nr:hypothetical protein GGR53DRAFT_519098 [Hypoxylon sp. FL1150]
MTTAREAPLCSSCLRIFSSPTEPSSPTSVYCLRPRLAKAHHHSMVSLKQAVEVKCPICLAVATSLPPEPLSLSPDKSATSFNITKHENEFKISIFVNVNNSTRPVFFNAARVERVRGNRDNELQGMDLCHRWISDCLHFEDPEHHSSCRNHRTRSQTALRRPSHLIQLRREGDDTQSSYTVCKYLPGRELSPDLPYATVSYPGWIDNPATTGELVFENLGSWTSTSQLPVYLHQAAQIAFDAGVQYLWIPMFCANHAEDLITTAHIFAGSAFNIAAMTCVKSSDPLLSSGELSRMPIVRPRWDPEQALAIYRSDSFRDSVTDSSMWDSALFYVEALLSPATLYCGKDQIWWQCYHGRGALCSETLAMTGSHCRTDDNQEGILGQLEPSRLYTREYYKSYSNLDPRASVPFSESGSSNHVDLHGFESLHKCLAALWTWIIATYSMTSTRTLEERVGVIDGIAKCVPLLATPGAADMFNSLSYAHGCWSADLVEQLSWHFAGDEVQDGEALPHRIDSTARFPTWSWLSLPGRVNFQFPIATHPGITSSTLLPNEIFLSPLAKARFSTAEECNAIGVDAAGSKALGEAT